MRKKTSNNSSPDPGAPAPREDEDKKSLTVYPLAVREEDAVALDIRTLKQKLKDIAEFQVLVRENLHQDIDYGIIPGTQKPTLYKSGAEKITKLLGLADTFETESETLDFEKPFFSFDIKCKLVSLRTGVVVSEGVGHANSMEGKWRYRWIYDNKLSPEQAKIKDTFKVKKYQKEGRWIIQYQVPNDDIFSLVNTIKKVAKKRSLVDAALSAGRLSDLFTQDVEDLKEFADAVQEEQHDEPKPKPAAKPKPQQEEKPQPKPQPTTQPPPPQAKPSTPAAKPASQEPPNKESVIARIKDKLLGKTIDPKEFKLFLLDFQKSHKVQFVGVNQYGKASFHEGDMGDLERLSYYIEYMTQQYRTWDEARKPQANETELIQAPFDDVPEEEGEDEEEEEEGLEDDEQR